MARPYKFTLLSGKTIYIEGVYLQKGSVTHAPGPSATPSIGGYANALTLWQYYAELTYY